MTRTPIGTPAAGSVAEDPVPGLARYAAVFAGLLEAVLICDPEGRISDVNPAAERLFGYPAADLIGTFPGAIRDPADAQARATAVRLHLAEHAEWSSDVPYFRGDGERRIGRARWTAVYEPPGSAAAGYVGVIRDVTEELLTADLLAEAELRWRLTIDAAPIGIALVALDGHFLRVNAALCSIVGYSETDLLALTFQDITHPDDLDADLALLAQLVDAQIDRYTLEKRYRHEAGHHVWARLSVAIVWSEGGDPLHFISQIEDITAARQAQQRLTTIIASARDAFISIGRTGLVTEWNAAAEAMFGWTRQEALGLILADLVMSPGMAAAHNAGLARLAGGGQPVILSQRLELTATRRGGAEFPIELTVWRAEDSPEEEFHAFLRDISDRVSAEVRARAFTARQQAIVEAQLDIAQVELTPSKVMQRICDRAASVTNAGAAVIELRDGDNMVYRSTSAAVREHLGLRLPVAGSLSGRSATTGQTLICLDTSNDPRVDAEACRTVGVGSMIVTPLRTGNAIVGVLKVIAAEPGHFDDDDAGALELLAVPFATAMTNAWRLEATSQQAMSDPMTGLANRAYALHELERSLARQHRHGGHTAVIFVDLDRFKAVNDTWGHAAGDELLSSVAEKLRQAVRTTDTPARYGGDEFVIICEGLTAPEDAEVLAQRLVRAIPGTYQLESGTASIGASVGVAVAAAAVPAAQLLRLADEAMYEAKQAGGSRYSIRTVG
jgi:diguanylate cyclase (GGDEF)-like protein/PAS domain S-box-containing protein